MFKFQNEGQKLFLPDGSLSASTNLKAITVKTMVKTMLARSAKSMGAMP